MLRKIFIGALVVALTPALALAAPTAMTAKPRPAVTHTVKLQTKTHMVKKAEKIRLIQKHRAIKKMKTVAHPKHRAPMQRV